MPNRNYERGAALERKVVSDLRAQGWTAFRVAGSRGVADVVALRPGASVLAQCKSGASPYSGFGPADRQALLDEAALAGSRAVLVWKRPRKHGYETIESAEWP